MHAVSQVLGQLRQQRDLFVEEGVGLGGVDGDGAEGLAIGQQWQGQRRGVAAAQGLLAQGAKRGSVSMFRQEHGWAVRIAVPVGPRPRSASAQVSRRVSRYPSSKPEQATGRTLLFSSSSA